MAPGKGREGSISSAGLSSDNGSSRDGSDASMGVLRGEEGESSLMKGSSGSRKDAFFSVMFYCFSDKLLEKDWKFMLLCTLYMWAQQLNLVFGANFYGWDINWSGNNFWRFYNRLLLSNAAAERGWGLYVAVLVVFIVFYVGVALITTWLNFYMRTRTKFRWKWPSQLLRIAVALQRSFYTSFACLLIVSFTCNNDSGRTMFYFPSRGCFSMPQGVLFGITLAVEIIYMFPALSGALMESGDTDFHSKNFFSSSVGAYILRVNLVRIALPIVPAAFQLYPKWHGFFNFMITSYLLYITVRRVPMHRTWLNCVHAFLNAFLWWAAALAFIGVFYNEYWPKLTIAFLAGMGPLGLASAALTYYRLKRIWKVAETFAGWTPQTPLRETHRFWDEYEVEVVARVCRKTVTTELLDVVPDPYWTDVASRVLQAGLQQFPNAAFLYVVHASLQAQLLKDPSGGVGQLQKAKKCDGITWVERFQVFVREQTKLAQKGKDQDQSSTFDAVTWAEFQASYKIAIRSHRSALTTVKSFWHLLLRSDVQMVSLVRNFLRIDSSRDAAERSYKALMERYPNNPRVLRAYARFLQQVKNDPHGSRRYSAMADKVEGQQDEARREMIFSQILDRQFKDEASSKTMAMIDETMDAVILINIEGMIQYANAPALKMFGYRKGELEGRNINMLMPAPFSQQHDGYLRNYATTRNPKILDTTREVVALHKLRHVFPVSLCVTPITMGAAETYMGVIKALDDDSTMATVYCTATGTVVCVNRGFSNLFAWQSLDVVGKAFHEYTSQPEKVNHIIAAVCASDGQEKDFDKLLLTHKFGEEIEVEVRGRKAGTASVSITVLEMSIANNIWTGLMSVNPTTGRIVYANSSVCDLVGITNEHLIKMRLHEIMVEPYAQLHQRWIKGRDLSRAPGLKCRAGRTVEFKHVSGKVMPALLEISERSTDAGNVYNAKVCPVKSKLDEEWSRITLSVAPDGTINGHEGKLTLFGLEREALVGKPLDVLLDYYRADGSGAATIHARLLQEIREQARTLRVAVAPRGKRTVPAVMQLIPAIEEEAPSTMHLYRADCLEGVLELDSQCIVKKCSEEAGLLFGLAPTALVGGKIQKVLPRVCPGGKTTELMVVRGQKGGGSKRSHGPVQAAEGVHTDNRGLHVSFQAVESTERPGRYLVRIIVPKPISAYSTLGRPGTSAPLSALAAEQGLDPVARIPVQELSSMGDLIQASSSGGGCPFGFGGSKEPSAAPPSGPPLAPAPAPALPSSRPATGGGCPFGFGGSKEPSAVDVASRPDTGAVSWPRTGSRPHTGSACPINLNTQEVLESLSFPPTSRFALQQAHILERSRQATEEGKDPNLDGEGRAQTAGDASRSVAPTGEAETAVPAEAGGEVAGTIEHTQSEQDGSSEGGGEEEVDQEELAKKMELVHAWLDTAADPAAMAAASGGATGPVPATAGASRPQTGLNGAPASTRPATAVVSVIAAAGAGAQNALEVVVASPGALAEVQIGGPKAAIKAADQRTAEDSSVAAGSDTASMAATEDGDDDGADYARLKRYKKALKLLNSQGARQAINSLKAQVRWVLLFMVVAHVALFTSSLVVLNSSLAYIENLDKAGMAARNAISICTDLRNLMWAAQEIELGTVRTYPDPYETAKVIQAKAAVVEANQRDLYFAKGSAAAATTDVYDNTMLHNKLYIDVEPAPIDIVVPMSLWDSTQRFINAAKAVAGMTMAEWQDIENDFSFRFVMDNAPESISDKLLKVVDMAAWMAVEKLSNIAMVSWILLGIEAGLILLCAAYVFKLLHAVAVERFNLFSIFLFIPRPAVLALARAEIVVDELDESSDEEDEVVPGNVEGTGNAGGSAVVSTAVNVRVLAQKARQDRLAISKRSLTKLLAPFALLLGVAIALWCLQYYWISSATTRVMGLDASERAFVYNARVRFFSNELSCQGNGSTVETPVLTELRQQLAKAAKRYKFWHETILYGDDSAYRTLDQSSNMAAINYPGLHFISTLYSSVERNRLLYGEGCHRENQTECLPKGHSWYYTTNFGLNTMVYYMIEQAEILVEDAAAAINVNHPAIKYINEVGLKDAVGAWTQSNRIFMYIANFSYIRAVQGVVLAFILVATLAYLYFLFMPYVKVTGLESRKVAEVVSYLPQGVDIAQLIELSNIKGGGVESAGGVGRSASQSSDAEL